MADQNLVVIGGGGHALSVADVVTDMVGVTLTGFIDAADDAPLTELGYQCLGNDDAIRCLVQAGYVFHVAIGQLVSPDRRIKAFDGLRALGATVVNLVSVKAHISQHAKLADNIFVGHGAVVNAGAQIGDNCIINTGCIIEHGAVIEPHCHIAPGAIILGGATLGTGSFVGAGAIVREAVALPAQTVIPAGEFRKQNV